jgi:hypothetical protein
MDNIPIGDYGPNALPITTKRREKLETRNKILVEKKIEEIRQKKTLISKKPMKSR